MAKVELNTVCTYYLTLRWVPVKNTIFNSLKKTKSTPVKVIGQTKPSCSHPNLQTLSQQPLSKPPLPLTTHPFSHSPALNLLTPTFVPYPLEPEPNGLFVHKSISVTSNSP
jgi:hypothetical protein